MPGEPAEPLSAPRPAWVGFAGHLAPDPGRAWLRPGDAAHARMLRNLGARALHEPLLAALPMGDDGTLVTSAGRALRALLPGQPKPVAALTRSPEVTERLLPVLARPHDAPTALRDALAAQVLFSLALSDALREPVLLRGPLTLVHSATRRGLELLTGQRLTLGAPGLVREQRIDPWGPELGQKLIEQHGFAVPRRAPASLTTLGDALALIAARDPHAELVTEMFTALEVSAHPDATTLPLAIGRARLPGDDDAIGLAHALLRESALHKLTLLRLVDPLVHHEAELPSLLAAVDRWAARRLGLPATAASGTRDAFTPLGQQVLDELA